ncbi:MAG: hypothetical protein ACYTGO_18040 [Planctomycetota bacterium]
MFRRSLGVAGMLLAGFLWSGCSDASKLTDADTAEATASSAHTTAALGSMALEASLNQIDPTNFAPLSGPPSVNAVGNATSGTVTIDFGTGTQVNNATVSGTMIGTYSVSGNSVTVTVTFSSLTANTSAGGDATFDGSLTLAATLNGTSNIAGTLTGSVTASNGGDTTTVTPNLTYAIDGTPTTGDITLAGTVGLDSSVYGDWTATLTAITATVSQTDRVINSGTLAMARTSFPPITATMVFTGQNSGTLDVSPGGFSKNFTL